MVKGTVRSGYEDWRRSQEIKDHFHVCSKWLRENRMKD